MCSPTATTWGWLAKGFSQRDMLILKSMFVSFNKLHHVCIALYWYRMAFINIRIAGRMVALRLLQRRLSPIPSLKKWQDMCRLTVLRSCSQHTNDNKNKRHQINILDKLYDVDSMTNINPNIRAKISRRLHNQQYHPLCLLRQRIQDFFYRNHLRRNGNPIFAVFDNLSPVVSLKQNFDDLLVPEDHPSRHPKVSSKASFIAYTV